MDTNPDKTEQGELSRIANYLNRAKSHCEKWHNDIDKSRRLYDFDHFDHKPKQGENLYPDPTYTNVVDLAVGVLLANQLDWTAYGFSPSLKEERDTSRIEKFLAGVLASNSEREEYSIPYETIMHFVRDGSVALYGVWDGDLAAKGITGFDRVDESGQPVQAQLFTNMPLRTQVIDPRKMYMLPGGHGRWSKVMRVETMTVYDVEQMYEVELEDFSHLSLDDKMTTEGQLVDFWEMVERPSSYESSDPKAAEQGMAWFMTQPFALRNAITFNGKFVRPLQYMPGYDDYPYTIGFFKPVSRDKPEDWGHSILRPLESSVSLLERSINRRQRQIDVYSSLPMVVKALAGRDVSVDPGLATTVHLTPEEDIGFPIWPGNPPDVATQIDFLRSRVQQSGFSDVMYGGSASSSGYALSQLGDQNRIRLTQPTEHLNLLFTKWAHKTIKLATYFASTAYIQVYGSTKGQQFSDQVQGLSLDGYRVVAEVHPVFPNEETRKHAMATQVVGILSEQTIMEKYLNVKQPSDERQRKMQEAVFKHPLMQQYIMISALQDLTEAGDQAAFMVLQQMQQQGQPTAGPGRPPEPRSPEQPLGLQSPTGQPTPQAMGGVPWGQSEMGAQEAMAGAAPTMEGVI